MSLDCNSDDRRFVNRRNVLKSTTAGIAGIGALTGTAVAGGCSVETCSDDSASSWEKDVYFWGKENITKGGSCLYEYATSADNGGQVKRISSYCESEDCAYHITDKNGNELAVGAGQVDDGYRDGYRFNGPFRYYQTQREQNVEIYGDFDTTNEWNVRVEGLGQYTVYFADDTEPRKATNCESTDETGIQDGDGYINGTVDGFDKEDDADTYTVYGDIKRIFIRNNENSTLRVVATSSP